MQIVIEKNCGFITTFIVVKRILLELSHNLA